MRNLSKAACAFGVITAVAVIASAADARAYQHSGPYAYSGAYERQVGSSIPYDAGGIAYGPGQRDIDSSDDFQLQGR
jgi:hypothetical protein